jgi:hypothetical protein
MSDPLVPDDLWRSSGREVGRSHERPVKLHADKADDSSNPGRGLRSRGITHRIARRGIDSNKRLGRHLWLVGWPLAWLFGCRRLGVTHGRRADLLQGPMHLACVPICVGFLAPPPSGQGRLVARALGTAASPAAVDSGA